MCTYIKTHIYIYIDHLLGFALLNTGLDNLESAPCLLKLMDLHFAEGHRGA